MDMTLMSLARVLFAMAMLAMIAYVLLDGTRPQVRVGISEHLCKNLRHGVFWVRTEEGGLVQRPFLVSDERILRTPSTRVLRSLTNQARRMGFQPDHIEITVDGKTMVYSTQTPRPTLTLVT